MPIRRTWWTMWCTAASPTCRAPCRAPPPMRSTTLRCPSCWRSPTRAGSARSPTTSICAMASTWRAARSRTRKSRRRSARLFRRQQSSYGSRGALEVVFRSEDVGADAQVLATRIDLEAARLDLLRKVHRVGVPHGDEGAVVGADAGGPRQQVAEHRLLRERILAQALDAELERELESGQGLHAWQHRRRRFEPGIAAGPELRWLGARVKEWILLRIPPGVDGAHAVDEPRPDIEPARTRAAAQGLVGAADREVRAERLEIDWHDARVVVDIEHHQRAGGVRVVDEPRQVLHHLARAEHHRGEYDQGSDRRVQIGQRRHAQLDAAPVAVHAQDEIDR